VELRSQYKPHDGQEHNLRPSSRNEYSDAKQTPHRFNDSIIDIEDLRIDSIPKQSKYMNDPESLSKRLNDLVAENDELKLREANSLANFSIHKPDYESNEDNIDPFIDTILYLSNYICELEASNNKPLS
jgi:hypothetical protein